MRDPTKQEGRQQQRTQNFRAETDVSGFWESSGILPPNYWDSLLKKMLP